MTAPLAWEQRTSASPPSDAPEEPAFEALKVYPGPPRSTAHSTCLWVS